MQYWEDISNQKENQRSPAPSNVPVPYFEVNINWNRVVENTAVSAGLISAGYLVLKIGEAVLNTALKPILPIFVVPINKNFEDNYNVEI